MKEKTKRRILIVIIVILLLLLVGAVYIILQRQEDKPTLPTDSSAVEYEGEKDTYRLPNGQAGIAIPGLPESLVFAANQTEQKVNFYNPEGNNCLFLMTLYIDDCQYWQSGYVAAGQGYYNITLSEPIAEGEHNAYLLIQCFRDDGTALNSAKVGTKIIASEVNP